jgi:hypothetical protein
MKSLKKVLSNDLVFKKVLHVVVIPVEAGIQLF